MKIITSIYRSAKKEGMYLYVEKQKGLEPVPEALLELFGTPQHAMTLLITPERKLARADTAKVLAGLEEKGYYLQMPPSGEDYMQSINQHNSKLV